METSNIIALVLGGTGFIISIISLVLTPSLALKSKRLEKRLEFRFTLFQRILALKEYIDQPYEESDFKPLLQEIHILIQLYGHNSEIKSFRELGESFNNYAQYKNATSLENLKTTFSDFFSTSFNAYRKEIVLDKLIDDKK